MFETKNVTTHVSARHYTLQIQNIPRYAQVTG